MTVDVPVEWIEAAAGGVVTAFGAMATAIGALWRKVNRIESSCAAERAVHAERERELTERLISEMRGRVAAYNAPAPPVPTIPPPPESEPTEVRKLREIVGEQERDRLLADYLSSQKPPPTRKH
jgi:hypothetical protein